MVGQPEVEQASGAYGNYHENAKEMGSGDDPAFESVVMPVRGNAPDMVSEPLQSLGEERGGAALSPISHHTPLFPRTSAYASCFHAQ